MRNLFTVSGLLLIASAAGAQQFATELKSTEIVPGIHMIEGADGFAGGNVGLLTGESRTVLIDDFVEPLSDTLIDIASDIAGKPVDFVINTHAHGDHVGGNAALAGDGATVVSHDQLRERLLADENFDPAGLPIITFSDAMTFHLNDLTAHVFHVAKAHTDGDAVIHFPEANVIHTGDIMFHRLFPFIDLDSGGTVEGFIKAQQKLIAIADADTKIIPGHGSLASRADLERDNAMLVDARSRVKALVDEGLSADEIVARNPLGIYHDVYNWGFITTERMTRTLHRDLTQ